jgi:rhomboid protease GluP
MPQFQTAVRRMPTPVVTYAITAGCVAVYLAMCASGASWIDPSSLDGVRWGADFGPLTLGGQWWRALTNMFVHFGLVHIGFNLWCLWNLGRALEFFMGRKAFAATYLASGVAASIVSLWWHPWEVAAGASGAIFGAAGAFASYVFLKRIALVPAAMKSLRNSLAAFIIFNLGFGEIYGRVDNSAHVGGLLAGLILGAIVPPMVGARKRVDTAAEMHGAGTGDRERRAKANRVAWAIIFGSAIVLTLAMIWVRKDHADAASYGAAAELISSGHTDQAIAELQQLAQNNPRMIPAQMLLGEILLQRGDAADAVAPLEWAVASDQTDPQNQQNLALAYLGANRPSDALVHIGTATGAEKNPPPSASFIRGIAKAETGDRAGAIQDLQAAKTAEPDLAEASDDLNAIGRADGGTLPQLEIPYAKLLAKSDGWPVFP